MFNEENLKDIKELSLANEEIFQNRLNTENTLH